MPLHLHENHLNSEHLEFVSNQLNIKNPVTGSLVKTHRTTIDFETTSPATIGTIPAQGIVTKVIVKVNTTFDGSTPTLNIGISGNDTKYADYTAVPIETSGTHIKHLYELESSNVDAIATITLSAATQGTADILIEYTEN